VYVGVLAFVRSGWVGINGGKIYGFGNGGRYWTGMNQSSIYAYRLYFYTDDVSSSDVYDKYFGFPLRCLYPGSA